MSLTKQKQYCCGFATFICIPNCGQTRDRPWRWHRTCAQALKSHSIMAGAYSAAAATADDIAYHKNPSSTQFITRNKRLSKDIPRGNAEANDKALDKDQGEYSWRLKHAHPAKKHINHVLKVHSHHLSISWPIDQFPRVDRCTPIIKISCTSLRMTSCQLRSLQRQQTREVHPIVSGSSNQ